MMICIQDATLTQTIKAKAFLHIPFNKVFHHKILCSVILVACSNKINKQKCIGRFRREGENNKHLRI